MPNNPKNPSDFIFSYELEITSGSGDLFLATKSVLDAMMSFGQSGGFRERGNDPQTCDHWYTRLAAALTAYFVRPDTRLTLAQMDYLCRRKQLIAYIYAASGYRSTKHLHRVMGSRQGNDITFTGDRVIVLLAVVGIDDLTDELLDLAAGQEPHIFLTLLLGWLCQRAVLSPEGERNRTRLLEMAVRCEGVGITDAALEPIAHAWMYCSYATSETKHHVKLTLNKLLRTKMASAGVQENGAQYQRKKRPKMLVIHERFRSEHAMFRCYAPSIEKMSNHFQLIALAQKSQIDDQSEPLFEDITVLPDNLPPLAEVVDLIKDMSPDVIYYPSIGMSHWTIMLAGLRLAPIQLMSHGHPATTMWPTIDYAYVCELEGDIASLHSERLLVGNRWADFSPHSELPVELPPLQPPSDREVRVAVNSKVMKLSHRLLDICRRLQQEADYPVRFSFFPGERFIFYDGLVSAIQSRVPNADVVPYTSYDKFLQELCKCDLALASFPFGNTNSTVDTCLLGIPTVAHYGPESPAQSDRLVIETAGLADWLVCDSDELYFETALSLINSENRRVSAMNGLDRHRIRSNLFDRTEIKEANPIADVFYHVYQNHEALIERDQRIISHREIKDIP